MSSSKSPAKARWKPRRHIALLDRREEADLAEVHRYDGHRRARVELQRAQDRAVAAENDADVGVTILRDDDPVARLDVVLAGLLGIEDELHAGVARRDLSSQARASSRAGDGA